jgi:hypothetical protein
MAYREFLDLNDVRWRVWATFPTVGKILSKGFEQGWLTFESNTERWRLAPIPEHWEDFPDARLRTMLKDASPSRRKTPASKRITPPLPSTGTGEA